MRVRGAAAVRQHRAAGPLPVVAARLRQAAQERERAQGQGDRRLPPRQLQGPVQDPREPPVLAAQPSQAAGAVAQGALRRGGAAARPAAGRRRQVPRAPQVPAAAHHLGRRGDQLLLQGEESVGAARLVQPEPLSQSAGEARAGRDDRPHHHPGLQLVQKSSPT